MIQSMKDGCVSTVQCNSGALISPIKKRLPWAPWRRRIYLVHQIFLTLFLVVHRYLHASETVARILSSWGTIYFVPWLIRSSTWQYGAQLVTTMKLLNFCTNTWQKLHCSKKDRQIYRDTEIYQKWKTREKLRPNCICQNVTLKKYTYVHTTTFSAKLHINSVCLFTVH